MKILKWCIFTVLIGIIVFGCASFPQANSENQTLVIGMIIQQGTGYKTYGLATVNGTNKKGINLKIQELNGEKTYTIRTQKGGIFYSINIPEGVYKITQVYFKKDEGGSWASITWNSPKDSEFKIEIIKDKVNNLGTINWECESGVKNKLLFNREYEQVRDLFLETYKSSNWNEKEWINSKISS
jgi:hypothetical protein